LARWTTVSAIPIAQPANSADAIRLVVLSTIKHEEECQDDLRRECATEVEADQRVLTPAVGSKSDRLSRVELRTFEDSPQRDGSDDSAANCAVR
jgi:hypothetical protein